MENAWSSYLLGCAAAIVLHELGHLLAAWVTGIRIKRVGISWKGPYIVRERGHDLVNACVALAGPALNLVVAVCCWNSGPQFALINLVLGISNLLPFVPGGDGQHAMASIRTLRVLRNPVLDGKPF